VANGAVNYSTSDPCFICNRPLGGQVYTWLDKVTNKRELLCPNCVVLPNNCYVCSMPVNDTAVDLHDTRFLCKRDAKTVMLDGGEILELCRQTKDALDTQLSRFISLPENVEFSVVDRQTIIELTQIPGNDYSCPNVLGYTRVDTNDPQRDDPGAHDFHMCARIGACLDAGKHSAFAAAQAESGRRRRFL